MRTKQNKPIVTYQNWPAQSNGVLIPIYNMHERFQQVGVQQVYATTCDVGGHKGPHLHKKRWGYFTCVSGDVKIIAKFPDGYREAYTGESYGFNTVEVPAGIPSKIINIGSKIAIIINTTSPAWTPDNPDDEPVEGWDYGGKE